jgi:hypothetical protein
MKKVALRDIGLVMLAVFALTIIAYPLIFNPAKRPVPAATAVTAPVPDAIQR